MDNNKNRICVHCEHANYPKVEFCSRCGEPLHRKDNVNLSFWAKWLYHLIDAVFWFVDESVRWWEIGTLSIKMKELRQKRAQLLKDFEAEEDKGGETSITKKQELMGITEELSRYSHQEKLIRVQCWGMTPEIIFLLIFSLFIMGAIFIRPGKTILPKKNHFSSNFGGQVARAKDIFITGQSVITSAKWLNNMLYVGGDGGLLKINATTSVATYVHDLPNDFFVRDLAIDNNRLIIAGYSGIYTLENKLINPLYTSQKLNNNLINCIALSKKGNYLIGTIGSGLLRGNDKSVKYVLGTQGYTVNGFGRLGQDLWIMHEKGILTGHGNKYKPLLLQILAGRHLRAIVTTEKNVFIGTDKGIVAGYKNYKNWVWTLVSAGKPGIVNDLVLAGDILFIGSDDGVFRFSDGKIEQLSSIPCKAIALGDKYLAAINADSVMLFSFSGFKMNISGYSMTPLSPAIGTFTRGTSLISMTSVPKFRIGNLPDLKKNSRTNVSSQSLPIAQETAEHNKLNMKYSLPPELQKPIFSDLVKLDQVFYLATENRGVWIYEHGVWKPIENIPTKGVNKLVKKGNICFAYGLNAGLFKIKYDVATRILKNEQTSNLVSACAETEKSIILLYTSGKLIRITENGSAKDLSAIPIEFKGQFNSVWMLNNKMIVISDKGVLVREKDKQWNLVFFMGKISDTKIISARSNNKEQLFIALKDGRIFEYTSGKLLMLGVVRDQITAINYSECLWVAGKNALFFYENKKFTPLLFNVKEAILGAFPAPDGQSVRVFTESGSRVIVGRSHN